MTDVPGMAQPKTQVENELRMYYGGVKRADAMMSRAEDKGRAIDNPYAQEIVDEFVLPMAQAITTELAQQRPGIMKAHVVLLKALDPEAVAALAVRACLNYLMEHGSDRTDLRNVAAAVGKTIHSELILAQIADSHPALFQVLVEDFNRRMSKSERHRMTVFKLEAKRAGIDVVEWPTGARDQVGVYLMGLLATMGMVDIEPLRSDGRGRKAPRAVTLTETALARIQEVKGFVSITMPVYGPCIEPPRKWTTPIDGGFHTRELRRACPCVVRHRLSRTPHYQEAAMPKVLAAVNALQRTRWAVNTAVLDVAVALAQGGTYMGAEAQPVRPPRAEWMDTEQGLWSDPQRAEFKAWKRSMAEFYTAKKLAASHMARFYAATRAAEMFRAYRAIWFVYFADSRGRLYPMTYGLNPQGQDLQKALLRFADGLPLRDATAVRWFCVHGANKWGFDKATLDERQAWVMDRADLIEGFADDPVNNTGWMQASSPMQFLAWCMEFLRWRENPVGFLSYLPVSMDGSCNGLQNLSALLRDEIGGEATNLTDNEHMQDIYQRVADAAAARLAVVDYEDPRKALMVRKWREHGVARDIVKRSIMTTPYGVTKRSATDYVISDYLRTPAKHPFASDEHMVAAAVLMDSVWPAIGDVIVKGREAMEWLKKSARVIIKGMEGEDEPYILWDSPSGFPCAQSYFAVKQHRINTRLHGPMKISVVTETDDADSGRHSSGLAPNFVHSMDAAHLHLTAAACSSHRIDALAMIHDDYGTHAANAQELYNVIREQFVAMYEEHDPIQEFYNRYPGIPAPPSKGRLDIREVLKSKYFFS